MKFFTRREFACKDGCGFDTVDFELAEICEAVRIFECRPVVVNSGCRCDEHNADVGGVKGSQHTLGRAADLKVRDPEQTYEFLCKRYPGRYGFGLYNSFVHADSRSDGPARWDNRV